MADLDLSTVALLENCAYTGGEIVPTGGGVGGVMSFAIPAIRLVTGASFDIEIDLAEASASVAAYSLIGPTLDDLNDSTAYYVSDPTEHTSGTTLTFSFGPAFEDYEAAIVDGETYVLFQVQHTPGNTESVTAMRTTVGDWVNLDLSDAVFFTDTDTMDTYGEYSGGNIVESAGGAPKYHFPGLVLNDALEYEFEATLVTEGGYLWILAMEDATDAEFTDGDDYELGYRFEAGETVISVLVGPGTNDWDEAATAEYDAVRFETVDISALRYRIAVEEEEPEPEDPTTADDAGEAVGLDGGGVATWDPPVATRPTGAWPSINTTVARRVIGATSTATGFPIVPQPAEASKPRLRERILVGGKDVTFFRDVPTPAPDTRRIMPLSFGDGGVLTFPQTSLYGDDVPGTDDLWWLRYGKKVVIQLVDDATNAVVIPDYWIGYVSLPPYPNSDGNWCVDLSGDAAGRLSTIKVPGPRFSKNRDVLIRCANDLTTVGRPVEPRFPYSGIEVASRGGMSGLDHFNEHIVLAQTNTGVQWTCRWSTLQQAYVFAQKDLETITATVYLDGALVTPSLMPGAPVNRVWSTGVNDRGERITHVAAPGIIQGTAPEFPGTLEEGDDNEDVTVLLWQLTYTGYLDLDDHPGGFDQDVVDAVEELQEDAGLTVTGIVNSATWDALFDLTSTQKGINFIHERPAASSPSVEKFNRSASGAILGLNPDYDPDHIKSDADFDMGRASRRKIKRWSKNELVSPSEVHWSGLLTFNVGQDGVGSGGLLYGEDDGESTLTAADVMDPRELVEGDVLWVPNFMGGTLLPVVGVDRRGNGVVDVLVDTRGQDTRKAWENHARNVDSKHNPARAWDGRTRQSAIQNDATIEWVDFCGKLTQNIPLEGGWSEPVPIFSGQEGAISRVREILGDDREFAVTVTSQPGYTARWDDLIPNPLADPGDDLPWYEQDAVRDFLEEKGLVYAAGTFKEPCGYGYARHTGDDGVTPTDAPLTGRHFDDGSWSYRTLAEPMLYVRIYLAGAATTLQRGRVFRQQLDSSGT